jgi:hypothetical protein
MVGILVHGNNHFILSGPLPDEAVALALARHWSIIQIGETKSSSFGRCEIRLREFRENLEWAVIVPGDRGPSQGVMELIWFFICTICRTSRLRYRRVRRRSRIAVVAM